MTRYYFHVRTSKGLERDPEGSEYLSLEAARDDAMRSAKESVAEALIKGERLHDAVDGSFEVSTEAGHVVLSIRFEDAAEAEDHAPKGGR